MARAKDESGTKATRGRRSKTRDDVVAKVQAKFGGHRDSPKLQMEELVAAVLAEVCEGYPPAEVVRRVNSKYGERLEPRLNREDPYDIVSYAAKKRRLRFVATTEGDLRQRLQDWAPSLLQVDVVTTPVVAHVAAHGAEMLLTLLRNHHREHPEQREIHVGFAGGETLRLLAQELALLLSDISRPLSLPRIVFHAMVGGLNSDRPANPNAFATYLVNDIHTLQVTTGFVGLHAPAIIREEHYDLLRGMEGIREAFDQADHLDMIVTSAGRWQCGHSTLYKLYGPEERSVLSEQGCTGSILWSPLGPRGPIEVRTARRAMTIMDLPQLRKFVERGKRVLLVLGPCGACREPKTDILEAILRLEHHYITDLVADSTCVHNLLERTHP